MSHFAVPNNKKRIVEAYVGEYASGKSENAINRALNLINDFPQMQTTLVDLDLVEPAYTIRAAKSNLEARGLNVLGWSTDETFALGEAGQVIHPATRWALSQKGNIIFDIGYGSSGAKVLNLIENIDKEQQFKVILVINTSRPMTSNVEDIIDYIGSIDRVDALLSNTHMVEETTPEQVLEGLKLTQEVAKKTQLPIEALSIDQKFFNKYQDFIIPKSFNLPNLPIRVLERIMPDHFW